jgi:hypothetical protein
MLLVKSSMNEKLPTSILIPAPTVWPFMVALSIALIFAGLVTHAIVSVVGAIVLLRASVGWWFDVLPEQKEESVLVGPVVQVSRSSLAVDHLASGQSIHRVQIPTEVHPYSTGILGGLAGAVAMAAVAMLFGLLSQGSIWYPINLLAAGIISSLAAAPVEQLRSFSEAGLIAGTFIHGTISIFVGMLYAVSLPMFPRGASWRSGLLTPLLWSGLVASTLGYINPALNARIDWGWFVGSQIAFGLAASRVIARTTKIATMQNLPLAERLEIEAQRGPEEKSGL